MDGHQSSVSLLLIRMFDVPVPLPAEFRQRAVELARASDKPLVEVAKELGISRSCLQNWVRQARADADEAPGKLNSAEKRELAELRRRNRHLEMGMFSQSSLPAGP